MELGEEPTTMPKKAPPSMKTHVPKGSYADKADPAYAAERERVKAVVPQLLNLALRQRNVTAQQAADTMGISLGAFRDRIHGRKPIPVEELVGLAKVYDFDLTSLLDSNFSTRDLLEVASRMMGVDLLALVKADPGLLSSALGETPCVRTLALRSVPSGRLTSSRRSITSRGA
ncbi:MAG: helix-turn-helix domain-containing protein [Candidatus Neomicrothrix subdominans]